MKEFGQLLGGLLIAVPVIGAIVAVVLAVKLIIAFFPVILGLAVLLFLGYALVVGLIQIGTGNVK